MSALAAAERQKDLFKVIDQSPLDMEAHISSTARTQKTSAYDERVSRAVEQLPRTYIRSETIVMEYAFRLLQKGSLNVPDTGCINVKQARALLWNAAWLQERMNEKWELPAGCAQPVVKSEPADVVKSELAENFNLIIFGPGGTGKTAILKVVEALTQFFMAPDGTEMVKKLAPSNAAARLLGGDTIHAMCKLPFGRVSLSSKKGRLSKDRLQDHKSKWNMQAKAK